MCASEPLHVFSKPSSWPSDTLQWVEKLCSQRIPPDAVVCRACEKYIKCHTGKCDIIPRWLPTKSKAHRYCMVEGCGEVSHATTSIVSYALEYLDIAGVSDDFTSQSLSLCNCHYQLLYREVHYPQPCAACSSEPRYGGEYTRRCPEPDRITAFLQETFDFCGVLTKISKICKLCYMFHWQILLQLNAGSSMATDTLNSTVSDLETKLAHFETDGVYIVCDKSFLTWNICKVSLDLARVKKPFFSHTCILPFTSI